MKASATFLVSLLVPLLSLYATPDDPETALKAYFAALSKADREAANRLTAHFPKFGESEVAAVTERYIELHKRPGYGPTLRGSKTIENCAVVVIFESPTDPDPAYLIRQKEVWKVLPKLTQFDREHFELASSELERFRTLESWYKTRVGEAALPGLEPFAHETIKTPSKMEKLLDAGLDPNTRSPDAYNEPLLWRSVRLRQPQTVRLLLDRGARVDEKSATFKKTALFQAAYDGSLEIAMLLIDRGADPNALDMHDNNALREAILANRPAMVRLLRDHGSNPDQENKDGESMRAIAQEHGTEEIQAVLANKVEGQPSMLQVSWTLDSQPAPASGGGR